MKYWLFFILSFPLILSAVIDWKSDGSKDFEVDIRLNPEKIEEGQSFEVIVEVMYPKTYVFDPNALLRQSLWFANPFNSPFAIKHSDIQKPVIDHSEIKQKIALILEPTQSGSIYFSFPVMNFTPVNSNSLPIDIMTPVFKIDVTPFGDSSVLPLAPLIPIEPKFPLGLTRINRVNLIDGPAALEEERQRTREMLERHRFPWSTVLISACFAAIAGLIYLMKKRIFEIIRVEKPPLELVQAPINTLLNLEKESPLHPENYRFYLSEAYNILLKCLEKHLKFEGKAMTVNEIIDQLNKYEPPLIKQKDIEEFFLKIDKIKFTNRHPSSEEITALIRSSQDLVSSLNSRNNLIVL